MSDNIIMWSPGVTLEGIERQVIEAAFRHFRQNKSATAHALGVSVRTIENKFARYAEDDKAAKDADERRKQARETQLARSRGLQPQFYDTVAPSPASRHGVESVANVASQSAMSMPQRKEVQDVLPSKIAANGQRKGR